VGAALAIYASIAELWTIYSPNFTIALDDFMNKKVAIILVLTLVALGYLAFYTFAPASLTHPGPQVNPESLKPSPAASAGRNTTTLQAFHNKDLAENFYTVSVPKYWMIQSSASPGEYDFVFTGGMAKTELMDVPDNTTLELFVLSQQEPMLKKSLSSYTRISYQRLNVSGNDAYQLAYLSNVNGAESETIRTYVAGADHAAVISFSLPQATIVKMQGEISLVIGSFSWEVAA
jgi:hypothetical protein